jgi:long-chain fatty acid transport protein
MIRVISLWILCAMSLVSAEASAAGFFLPGRGVAPLGRAGAFVASGEGDLNSLWYNPANLATLDRVTFTIDLALIDLDFQFQRAPRTTRNGDVITYDRVSNLAPPKPDPQLLIGGPIVEGLAWSFGFYAPYLSGHTFPEDGPQRYTLIDNDASLLLYSHLAIAWQPSSHIRVGVGLQNLSSNFVLVTKTAGYVGAFGDPEDPDLDILAETTVNSLVNLTGNAGVWIKLHEYVEAAIAVQLPVTLRDREAKLRTRLPDHPAFDNATQRGDSLDTSIRFPFMARLGVRFLQPTWDVEVALNYENWVTFDQIQANPNDVAIEGVPGLGTIPVAPLAIPMNWRDTFGVAIGGQLKPHDDWTIRLGYGYETSAVPDEYYSVFLADSTKHQLSTGARYRMGDLSFDLAASYYIMPDRQITNSQVRQINAADTEGDLSLIVGNGDYSQRYMIFGFGVNYAF